MQDRYRKEEVLDQSIACWRTSAGAEITSSSRTITEDHLRIYIQKMMNTLKHIGPIMYKWLINRNLVVEHLMQEDTKVMMEVLLLTFSIDLTFRKMMIDLDQVFHPELEHQICINVEIQETATIRSLNLR
jgi:hypothetical protein